ncbi:hypothetical protein D3C74_466440 [compost metagenome]
MFFLLEDISPFIILVAVDRVACFIDDLYHVTVAVVYIIILLVGCSIPFGQQAVRPPNIVRQSLVVRICFRNY